MRFSRIIIRNFKSIREMEIDGIENALILVGKNNTGKTSVLDAVRMLTGSYEPSERDFNEKKQNIEVEVELEITQEDLGRLHTLGRVSAYKRYEVWERGFLPETPLLPGRDPPFHLHLQSQRGEAVRGRIQEGQPADPGGAAPHVLHRCGAGDFPVSEGPALFPG